MAKAFAKAFYNSRAWKDGSKAYAKSVGNLCEACLKQGFYTPGKVVHHIIALTPDNINNPAITLGWDNLRLVCQDCHAKEHTRPKEIRYSFDESGNLAPLNPKSSHSRETGEWGNILPCNIT